MLKVIKLIKFSSYLIFVGACSVYGVLGLGCLLRSWARIFLNKGVGAGPIVTQLGPVCAQTYALSARSKLTASGTVADELRQTDMIIIIITEYSCLFKLMAI